MFLEFLELPQMQRAFVIALMAGPLAGLLGTFATLRGLSFFSDAISHGAITGMALGFALNLASDVNSTALQLFLVVFCSTLALVMAWLFETTKLRIDTVIAFSFTGSVAFGVLVISKLRGPRILEGALFGDILASSGQDVWLMAALSAVTMLFLFCNMRALTLSIVQENLARIEGINTRRLNYFFVVFIAVVVALLLRLLGALLISGLIVIPAAAARVIAHSFRQMLVWSALLGLIGAAVGVYTSYYAELPTGPTIVMTDVILLIGCMAAAWLSGTRRSKPRRTAKRDAPGRV